MSWWNPGAWIQQLSDVTYSVADRYTGGYENGFVPWGFPGGLTQDDFFVMPTVWLQDQFYWSGYNVTAFVSALSWRQAQMYQTKNYTLSWIGNARGDIQELMSVCVRRINNYMLVATLFLSLDATALFWVNNFDANCPSFVVNFFLDKHRVIYCVSF